MRVVLDTNVWLDWLVFDDAGIAHLRRAAGDGRLRITIDAPCLAELEHVLAYPLTRTPLSEARRDACRAEALRLAEFFERTSASCAAPLPACRDPDDQKFLELARDCGAATLITKDNALLALGRRKRHPLPFAVVTPGSFAA